MEDEYQTTVYSWFDKCGIISNVRTHLRHNLINALKNKDLVQKFESNAPKSAKQYVYDLLIAEYLWNHNYVYSLSVLASEAPLLVNFKKHIRPDDSSSTNSRQKLQNDYVYHTLETLGIEPKKVNGQSIIKEYAENNIPLLLCILQYFRTINDNDDLVNDKGSGGRNLKNQEMQTEETCKTVLQEKAQIANAKRKLIRQKDLFEAQLKQKETELREQTIIMEKQLSTLQHKLEQAQKLMHSYSMKEKQLSEDKRLENLRISQKENELIMREKLISQEAERLERERENYQQFDGNLKKLQDELSKVKRDIPQAERSCNLNVKNVEVQTDFESFISARNERNLLNQEKQDLNGLVQAQQSRIDHLTSRVISLTRKLEEIELKNFHSSGVPTPIIKVVNTNTHTILSENSSLDDIIHDARTRLLRLTEESMKADSDYFYFKNSMFKDSPQ